MVKSKKPVLGGYLTLPQEGLALSLCWVLAGCLFLNLSLVFPFVFHVMLLVIDFLLDFFFVLINISQLKNHYKRST
jgi:hypothetical protein